MKNMIVQEVSATGEIILSVKDYDPNAATNDTIVFAATGFSGWLIKIVGSNTIVNNDAPANLLSKIYRLIVW
jgi:hypothetical protein